MQSNRLPLAFAYEAVTEQTLLVNLDFASRLNDGNERNCIEVGGEKPVLVRFLGSVLSFALLTDPTMS
jgi:hypothetical protein